MTFIEYGLFESSTPSKVNLMWSSHEKIINKNSSYITSKKQNINPMTDKIATQLYNLSENDVNQAVVH